MWKWRQPKCISWISLHGESLPVFDHSWQVWILLVLSSAGDHSKLLVMTAALTRWQGLKCRFQWWLHPFIVTLKSHQNKAFLKLVSIIEGMVRWAVTPGKRCTDSEALEAGCWLLTSDISKWFKKRFFSTSVSWVRFWVGWFLLTLSVCSYCYETSYSVRVSVCVCVWERERERERETRERESIYVFVLVGWGGRGANGRVIWVF